MFKYRYDDEPSLLDCIRFFGFYMGPYVKGIQCNTFPMFHFELEGCGMRLVMVVGDVESWGFRESDIALF